MVQSNTNVLKMRGDMPGIWRAETGRALPGVGSPYTARQDQHICSFDTAEAIHWRALWFFNDSMLMDRRICFSRLYWACGATTEVTRPEVVVASMEESVRHNARLWLPPPRRPSVKWSVLASWIPQSCKVAESWSS